jgi:ankyrin repeat protein
MELIHAAGDGRLDLVTALIKGGANINVRDSGNDGATALCVASRWGHIEIVKVLLNHGAAVNAASDLGITPLLEAAENGNAHIVRLLLNAGADTEHRDDDNQTARALAKMNGHLDVVTVLNNY